MKLQSNSLDLLRFAARTGNKLFLLDTGHDGEDDVLFGVNQEEVWQDILHYVDDEIPEHWTLEEVTLDQVEAHFGD